MTTTFGQIEWSDDVFGVITKRQLIIKIYGFA
jgi:hypothetical protein